MACKAQKSKVLGVNGDIQCMFALDGEIYEERKIFVFRSTLRIPFRVAVWLSNTIVE